MPTRQSLLLAVAVSAIGRAAASGGGASSAAATEEEGSCVTSLTASNFEKEIRGKHALVVFFAPWCGHCQALHPHFENLCRDLSDQDDFLAAVVDATEEEDLARSHGVTGARDVLPGSVPPLRSQLSAVRPGRLSDHQLVRQARVLDWKG